MDHTTPSHHDHQQSAGHPAADRHAGHSTHLFKRKFWICLILTLPVIYLSHTISQLFGYQPVSFPSSEWIAPVLGTIVFVYGGLVFIQGAGRELRTKKPGMMTLVSLAIIVAFGYSVAVALGLEGMDFWWELTTLITIMLLGHWLEMASIQQTGRSLDALTKLMPDMAEVVHGEKTHMMAVTELNIGDVVLIRPGSRVPIDSKVISGQSDLDEALISGESKPVPKQVDDTLIGGTINGSGALRARVIHTSSDTVLAGIMKLVAEAQASQSQTQIVADRFAGYLFYAAVTIAIVTALGWIVFSEAAATFIIERVVTILVIACPHALGLAVPLVTSISTSRAAHNGLLIRSRQALENARLIDVFLFDKTGTLTTGQQNVVTIQGSGNTLALAAAIEQSSEHPIAHAIVAKAGDQHLTLQPVTDFSALEGRGAVGVIDGIETYVGGPRLLDILSIKPPEDQATIENTVVYVVQNEKIIGHIILADTIRPESRQAVQTLQAAGKRLAIVTGDNQAVTARIAEELGITQYYTGLLPADKIDIVKELQHSGDTVAMVGDGINDAPALTQADIGIAIGAGTDVAIQSADIILIGDDPRGVARTVALSRATYRKMIQNLAWGAGYNIITIPLATGIIPALTVSPLVGAILMSLSTIIVALNAQTLRWTKLDT